MAKARRKVPAGNYCSNARQLHRNNDSNREFQRMLHQKLGGRRHGRRNLANLADSNPRDVFIRRQFCSLLARNWTVAATPVLLQKRSFHRLLLCFAVLSGTQQWHKPCSNSYAGGQSKNPYRNQSSEDWLNSYDEILTVFWCTFAPIDHF